MDTREKLKVKVFSPYQTFFEGTAISLSALNQTGPFDVLAGHSNFFSVIKPGRVTVDTGFNNPVVIEIESGVLRVTDNTVTLYANV
jgi:F0F1-type ATP synthase epsilon subunit